MKRLLLFLFLLPLLAQGQFMSYYTQPTTTTTTTSTDFVPPSTWSDSLGAITAARMGADGSIPSNTIRILVNADNDPQTYTFSVTCVGGYKVKWGLNESWINYASGALAERTYDTAKCQTYSIIEIQPQGANGIASFSARLPVTFVANQYFTPSYLWISANYVGAAPDFSYAGNYMHIGRTLRAAYLKSVTSLGTYSFSGCSALTSITIPSSVTSLGTGCFSGCSALTSITIPSSVTTIGNYCFQTCYALTSIIIPSSVTTIGNNCFQTCYALTSIIIPSSVTSLGVSCFNSCSALTSITIPSSVTTIGNNCFQTCYAIKNIIYTGTTSVEDHSSFTQICEQIKQINWPNFKSTRFGSYGASGKLNKLGSVVNDTLPLIVNWAGSTFSSATIPQLNLSYNSLDTTQIRRIFQKLPTVGAVGSNTKQLTVVGCVNPNTGKGAANLSAAQLLYATSKGWQVLY